MHACLAALVDAYRAIVEQVNFNQRSSVVSEGIKSLQFSCEAFPRLYSGCLHGQRMYIRIGIVDALLSLAINCCETLITYPKA